MNHYFMTLPDVVFPENRFCAKCGEYFTHTNHLHGRDCQCKTCQQERLLTQPAPDAGDSASFLNLFYPIFNLLNKARRNPPQRR